MMNFARLQGLIETYTKSGVNPFYRDLYGMQKEKDALRLESWEDWKHLPLLTKEDLARIPLKKRLFAHISHVDHIRASGGTSGKPPVFNPRMNTTDMEYRARYYDFSGACLVNIPVGTPLWHERFQKSLGQVPRVVVFDPRNIRASLLLANSADVEMISLFTHHITAVGNILKRSGAAERIRYVEFSGGACSRLTFEYARSTFPNATLISTFGLSEGPLATFPCHPIDGTEPLEVFHGNDISYLELVDSAGVTVEPVQGAEGELVFTACAREHSVSPVFRYRTGDMVRVVDTACKEHGTWSFTPLGRKDLDFIRIQGGMLRIDEVVRVLRSIKNLVTEQFELHHYERPTREGPKTEVVVHVDPISPKDMDLSNLADRISHSLHVGPTFTYADGVARNLYLPLVCVLLIPSQQDSSKKSRQIFHHPTP